MKKRIAAALALAMLTALALTACGGKNDKDVIGTWTGDVDCGGIIGGIVSRAMTWLEPESGTETVGDSFKDINLRLVLTLKEDGTYSQSADSDSVRECLQQLNEKLQKIIANQMERVPSFEKDMQIEDLLENILEEAGTVMGGIVGSSGFTAILDYIAENLEAEGNYLARDGKIYFSSGLDADARDAVPCIYEKSGNRWMTIKADRTSGKKNVFQDFSPLVLKRIG